MEPFSLLHLASLQLPAARAELQFTGKLAYLTDCINSSQFGAFLISICKMGLLLVNLV